jgi:hypothetical protein
MRSPAVKNLLCLIFSILCFFVEMHSQQSMLTYAGNSGRETFYDVTTNGAGERYVCGVADNLDWIGAEVPRVEIISTVSIPNALGTNRYGFLLVLNNDCSALLKVYHFAAGVVEDIRFIKSNVQQGLSQSFYISCNTSDTESNNGGYIIAKLSDGFRNDMGTTQLDWVRVVWAASITKSVHPWDVSADGHVYYVSGEAHGYDWSAMYKLDGSGNRMVVENWRTHWTLGGSEWRGTPASANPSGGSAGLAYSGIVMKIGGRCELRSWNEEDFNIIQPDGNGGTRKGKWPADFLFDTPCDPANPTATGPGYTGYSYEACCPVWGATSIAVNRLNGDVYIGMNFKSYSNPASSPDFEPAVIAMDSTGTLKWWSRLYHEITPAGDTVESLPDQYIDALSLDYAHQMLVVGARCHGNNTENLWEGNVIAANPSANGFQNRFTGTFGDIHISWLGKLNWNNGNLMHSTYMAELFEGTTGLGNPLSDSNMAGWPDPNGGWPNVNTTRMAVNNLKSTSSGDVVVCSVGRRTMTTHNAFQENVNPFLPSVGSWNSFVRVYQSDLSKPLYSSLIVGVWDTLTGSGGGNTSLYGVWKTTDGVIVVGRQNADTSGNALGVDIPVAQVPSWGSSSSANESAILAYFKAENLYNPNDGPLLVTENDRDLLELAIWPNPAQDFIYLNTNSMNIGIVNYTLFDLSGREIQKGLLSNQRINLSNIHSGAYILQINNGMISISSKVVVLH